MQPQTNNFFETTARVPKVTIQKGLDIMWVTDREIVEDILFEKLFSSREFIEEVRETDELYEKDPNQFTSLSQLYRENKKLK